MSKVNQFHNRYIDESYLEEKSKFGYNPWSVLVQEAIIQEGAKLKDVSSDDEPEGLDKNESIETQAPQEEKQTAQEDNKQDQDQEQEQPLLSPEELQQLAEDFQSGKITEEILKQMVDKGQINNIDIQMMQEQLSSPEEEQERQINQVQEMVIRFNVYDKIMNLDNKLDVFMENFDDVNSSFYKDVQQIHEFIKVLNTLIFSLEINLVYQLYASLELQLIQLFEEYKETQATTQDEQTDKFN